ncbi:MAG: 2-C-methyl-D-erythritol 2,4-cyclodiphosphate synthase [Candidatus Caldatribacteriota bacterium]
MRVGFGYDVHPLVKGRKLVLGGEVIPYAKGLDGHSDADVLIHSLIDALFGAIGEGDIGQHFSPQDEQYKDISSLVLLNKTVQIIKRKGFIINNIDVSIVAEEPKIFPYFASMRKHISDILNLPEERINLKATTTEKLGFIGRKEGIASFCVVSLKQIKVEN